MRHVALATGCVAITLWTHGAGAQTPPDVDQAAVEALVAEGEALAQERQFTAAIERWKRADQMLARARHACLIGQAYARRELWPQAEIFFAECRQRATASEPVPGWLDFAERELNDKLAAITVAAVTLAVEPAIDGARFKVSSFAPDETVGPRVIHLTPGEYTITASAPGFAPAAQTIAIDSTEARTVTLPMRPTIDPDRTPPDPDLPPPVAPPTVTRGKLPWIVLGAGGVLAAVGGAYHATALRGAWRDLESTTDRTFYEGAGDQAWRDARRTTILLYSAAAATIVTGVVLRAVGVGDRRDAPVAIGVTPGGGGGVITVGWER